MRAEDQAAERQTSAQQLASCSELKLTSWHEELQDLGDLDLTRNGSFQMADLFCDGELNEWARILGVQPAEGIGKG